MNERSLIAGKLFCNSVLAASLVIFVKMAFETCDWTMFLLAHVFER